MNYNVKKHVSAYAYDTIKTNLTDLNNLQNFHYYIETVILLEDQNMDYQLAKKHILNVSNGEEIKSNFFYKTSLFNSLLEQNKKFKLTGSLCNEIMSNLEEWELYHFDIVTGVKVGPNKFESRSYNTRLYDMDKLYEYPSIISIDSDPQYHHIIEEFYNHFTIDKESLSYEQDPSVVKSCLDMSSEIEADALRIKKGENTDRLFTAFTGKSSDNNKHYMIDGEKTSTVDAIASQLSILVSDYMNTNPVIETEGDFEGFLNSFKPLSDKERNNFRFYKEPYKAFAKSICIQMLYKIRDVCKDNELFNLFFGYLLYGSLEPSSIIKTEHMKAIYGDNLSAYKSAYAKENRLKELLNYDMFQFNMFVEQKTSLKGEPYVDYKTLNLYNLLRLATYTPIIDCKTRELIEDDTYNIDILRIRKTFKQMVYGWLFGIKKGKDGEATFTNKHPFNKNNICDNNAFTGLIEYIKGLVRDTEDFTSLALYLQNKEAEIFIPAIKELEAKNIFTTSKHDALICKYSVASEVRSHLENRVRELYGANNCISFSVSNNEMGIEEMEVEKNDLSVVSKPVLTQEEVVETKKTIVDKRVGGESYTVKNVKSGQEYSGTVSELYKKCGIINKSNFRQVLTEKRKSSDGFNKVLI